MRLAAAVLLAGVAAVLALGAASASAQSLLAPLTDMQRWLPAPLPKQTLPPTRFSLIDIDDSAALRIESRASYGNLVHHVEADAAAARTLQWRWRLETAIDGADLQTKASDDAALKVCVLFEMPIQQVPFVERQLLRMARAATGQALPAATLCYVWAPLLKADTLLPNAHTKRMRWLVLQGAGTPLSAWRSERRDLVADFLRAFGDESAQVPPIVAVLVGADADNTGGRGAGFVAALELQAR